MLVKTDEALERALKYGRVRGTCEHCANGVTAYPEKDYAIKDELTADGIQRKVIRPKPYLKVKSRCKTCGTPICLRLI